MPDEVGNVATLACPVHSRILDIKPATSKEQSVVFIHDVAIDDQPDGDILSGDSVQQIWLRDCESWRPQHASGFLAEPRARVNSFRRGRRSQQRGHFGNVFQVECPSGCLPVFQCSVRPGSRRVNPHCVDRCGFGKKIFPLRRVAFDF